MVLAAIFALTAVVWVDHCPKVWGFKQCSVFFLLAIRTQNLTNGMKILSDTVLKKKALLIVFKTDFHLIYNSTFWCNIPHLLTWLHCTLLVMYQMPFATVTYSTQVRDFIFCSRAHESSWSPPEDLRASRPDPLNISLHLCI